ncbi:helix-turn-helix domain-containing protein [Paenibacillus xanthanilyticus]|uniref:Helix-turn-helix domain-containing protein n=1 Tax=Paenibacillus xanthanilyticus TaxID=1783531 RepID=A0ABV8KC73_9BACL
MTHTNLNPSRFVKVPYELLFRYTLLPKYKAEMSTLYALLIHYFNVETGYAWPNVDTLALSYGKSVRTTSEHLAILEEYGLLSACYDGNKKLFRPLAPIEDEAEFYRQYPAAEAERKRRETVREVERKRSADNMARRRRVVTE